MCWHLRHVVDGLPGKELTLAFDGHLGSEGDRRRPRCREHVQRTRRSFGGCLRTTLWPIQLIAAPLPIHLVGGRNAALHWCVSFDGHGVYPRAVERAFGWGGADYGQMVKVYGQTSEGQRRYSPPVCLGADKHRVMGNPDLDDTCTSHVERSNLTLRMHSRRFTRLTNAFSKKVEFHEYAVALHFMYYNFCKPHMTLTKERGGIKTTPAKAAGLTDRVWKIEELLPPDFV